MIISMDELRLLLNLRRDVEEEADARKRHEVVNTVEVDGVPYETFKDAEEEEDPVFSSATDEEETEPDSGYVEEYPDYPEVETYDMVQDIAVPAEPASGYVVVDLSKGWERVLHFGKTGWLGGSSVEYPVTVFPTKEAAQAAIVSTNEFENGQYAWSQNDFRVLPFNQAH